jgi:hypothetical protein
VKSRVTRETALLNSLRAGARDLTVAIARQIYHELKRLNHAGVYRLGEPSNPRRQQTKEFKAALAEQYHQPNRCC